MKWPLTTEKPETFSADKENHQGYVQAYLLTEKNLFQLVSLNIC